MFHHVQYVDLELLLSYLSQIFNIFYESPENNRSNRFLLAFGYTFCCFFLKIISKDIDLFLSPASTLGMVCSL